MENKQAICDALTETLKLTRNCEDIIRIEYNPNTECALICCKGADPIPVNVACDSGTALILDIMRRLP